MSLSGRTQGRSSPGPAATEDAMTILHLLTRLWARRVHRARRIDAIREMRRLPAHVLADLGIGAHQIEAAVDGLLGPDPRPVLGAGSAGRPANDRFPRITASPGRTPASTCGAG